MCTFILQKQNQKITVPGMVGWTLLDTAQHHNLPVHGTPSDSPWDYTTFGEGPASAEDHCYVQREYYDKCGSPGWQEVNVMNSEVKEHMTDM